MKYVEITDKWLSGFGYVSDINSDLRKKIVGTFVLVETMAWQHADKSILQWPTLAFAWFEKIWGNSVKSEISLS